MSKALRAGTLNKSIVFQKSIKVLAADNSSAETWSSIKKTRASINPINGSEYFIDKNLINEVDHYINIRKPNVELTPEMRIIYKNKIFDIKYILNPDERGTELMILAKKKISENVVFSRSLWLLEGGSGSLLAESGDYLINEGIL